VGVSTQFWSGYGKLVWIVARRVLLLVKDQVVRVLGHRVVLVGRCL
jgi:hypothetical protein